MPISPPKNKFNTPEEMCDAIKHIIFLRRKQAYQSQYDVMVCVHSVDAANAVFESISIEGTVITYGRTVLEALYKLEDDYWDDDGEYTSKGMVGDVSSDVYQLLDAQKPPEPDDFNRQEARELLTQEILALGDIITQSPVGLGAVVKTNVTGADGCQYFVEMTFREVSEKCFAIMGGLHITDDSQHPELEDTREFIIGSND